jgi:leucyl aminopeptidase
MLDVAFAPSALPRTGALVLLAEEEGEPDAIRLAADEATGGAVARALEAAEFKPKAGKVCTLLAPGAGLGRIVVVGIGKRAGLTPRTAEEAGAVAAAELSRESKASMAAVALPAELAAAMATGAALRSYRFDRYRTTEKPEERPTLAPVRSGPRGARRWRVCTSRATSSASPPTC